MHDQVCGVARAVQDAHDHKLALVMNIVDGVVAGEADTQTWRKVLAERRGLRENVEAARKRL